MEKIINQDQTQRKKSEQKFQSSDLEMPQIQQKKHQQSIEQISTNQRKQQQNNMELLVPVKRNQMGDRQRAISQQQQFNSEKNVKDFGVILNQERKYKKQAEIDAAILANRIALLKQEELKSWKKIQDTKRKTADIFNLKRTNETVEEQFKNRMLQNGSQKLFGFQDNGQRQKKQEQLNSIKEEALKQKQEEAKKMKQFLENNQKKREDFILTQKIEKQIKSQQIKQSRENIKSKHEEYKNKLKQKVMRQYRNDLEQTKSQKLNKYQEIKELERLENQLIKKLHDTQLQQKSAFDELEGVLSLKTKEFKNKFIKNRTHRILTEVQDNQLKNIEFEDDDDEDISEIQDPKQNKNTLNKYSRKRKIEFKKDFQF